MHDHDEDCECCKGGRDAFLDKLEANIQKYGWTVMCTGAEVNGQELPLSYTIGLAAKGHPELMLFGLQMSLAQPILSYFAVKQTEGKLALDTPLDELGNLPLILKAVAPAKAADFITMANHRAGREVSAIQIFWPDPKGLFPWEPGFDAKFDGWQPLLFMSVH